MPVGTEFSTILESPAEAEYAVDEATTSDLPMGVPQLMAEYINSLSKHRLPAFGR